MGWSAADLDAYYQRLKEPTAHAGQAGGVSREDGGTVYSFTVPGAPRTKKTSQRIAFIPAKGNACAKCGKVSAKGSRQCQFCGARLGFTKVLPSEAFGEWFAESMKYAPMIRAKLTQAGAALPLEGWIWVKATFYRDRNTGDLLGYEQALADFLQEPLTNDRGKRIRDGAGVYFDDVQIQSWDGSRLAKDSASPRIEVEIRVIGSRPVNGNLFAEEQ